MNKKEIRNLMIDKRKKIAHKKQLSTIIVDNIIDLDIYKRSKVIALYNSLESEVNTKSLINDALLEKKVLLPKIVNDKIVFVEINKNTKYTKSKLGVMEPIGNIYLGDIDLIIVPGVSFDKELNRLGFGKGYYDKFLSKKDIFKIGICFENQIVSKLPVDSDDIKMDLIITNKRVLKKV